MIAGSFLCYLAKTARDHEAGGARWPAAGMELVRVV
jgi:hypothetical protein